MFFLGELQPSTSAALKRHIEGESTAVVPEKKVKVLQDIIIFHPEHENRAITPPLRSPVETQTEKFLSSTTPRKENLKEVITNLKIENRKLQEDLQAAMEKVEKLENPTEDQFKAQCSKFLSPNISNFIKCQLDLSKKTKYGRRYTDNLKQFSLGLYFTGPKCYRQLQKTFWLPSYRSLCRYVEKVNFKAGINESLFKLLKMKVDKIPAIEKICVLCIDEMSLKTNLFYNFATDTIIGLEDNGEVKTSKPASSATIFMIRSIKSAWKQPIAYTFSATAYDAKKMKDLLEQIITSLHDIGIEIVCLISDMGSNCLELSKILGITTENPKFCLGNKEVFFYFDPPHLIKAARNNLLKYDFMWDNQKACWSDISAFFEKDQTCLNKLAPKLTKSHINPSQFERMRVKYASQVYSHTVSAALETYVMLGALHPEAKGTATICSKFDSLFDIFNSSNLYSPKKFNKPFKGDDYQIAFLHEMQQFLDDLIIKNNSKNKTVSVKFVKCWKITIIRLSVYFNKTS